MERLLRDSLGENLKIVWTQNRCLMLSLRRKNNITVLRLHESFASTDDILKKELIAYLLKPRSKVPKIINEFVRKTFPDTSERSSRVRLNTAGDIYDLEKIYQTINKSYFDDMLTGKITWGRKIFPKRRKSITFGSYYPKHSLIRIHPVLDAHFVPPYYIESVVHHEMVHEYLHTSNVNEKAGIVHSRKFRELEKVYHHHSLAMEWERKHLPMLLRYSPAPKTKIRSG